MNCYIVRSTKDDKTYGDFAKRQDAKKRRDELNGGKWDAEDVSHEYVVSRSPAHPHGASY